MCGATTLPNSYSWKKVVFLWGKNEDKNRGTIKTVLKTKERN